MVSSADSVGPGSPPHISGRLTLMSDTDMHATRSNELLFQVCPLSQVVLRHVMEMLILSSNLLDPYLWSFLPSSHLMRMITLQLLIDLDPTGIDLPSQDDLHSLRNEQDGLFHSPGVSLTHLRECSRSTTTRDLPYLGDERLLMCDQMYGRSIRQYPTSCCVRQTSLQFEYLADGVGMTRSKGRWGA